MESVESLIRQGVTHQMAGRLAESQALYRQALAIDPNNADAMHLLGLVSD